MSKEEEQKKAEEDAKEEAKEEAEEAVEEMAEEEPAQGPEEEAEKEPEEAPEEEAGEEDDEDDKGTEKKPDVENDKDKAEPEKKPSKGSMRKIIRVGGKDLDGALTVRRALPGVPGVGFMFGNAASKVCGFAGKTLGELSEDELKKLKDIIENPSKYEIPSWLYNRRFDPEEGKDGHLISAQLELRRKMDINELKKRKCYRGIRHIIGLPVRGQRTRSSFRRSATVGVSRVKAKPAAKAGGGKK